MEPNRPTQPVSFADVPASDGPPAFQILPVAYERTTSYGGGTIGGPAAVLEASQYLELWDEQYGVDPSAAGISTLPEVRPLSRALDAALQEIEAAALLAHRAESTLVAIGGEHAITAPLVRAAIQGLADDDGSREIGIVQFDAHADLRDRYEGSEHSHACVMRRLLELEIPTLPVGIRSLSSEEAKLIEERSLDVLWAHQLLHPERDHRALMHEAIEPLPDDVYLTFDVDFLDPAWMPSTGTPEPGGGDWYRTLELLEILFSERNVVAIDVVELAPIDGLSAPDFLVAKLIYKMMAMKQARVERDRSSTRPVRRRA